MSPGEGTLFQIAGLQRFSKHLPGVEAHVAEMPRPPPSTPLLQWQAWHVISCPINRQLRRHWRTLNPVDQL